MDKKWLIFGIIILFVSIGGGGLLVDIDGDDLNTMQELQYGTDVFSSDSDSDGLKDGKEIELQTDPTIADSDGDDLDDSNEVQKYNTDPNSVDTDDDGLHDGKEVLVHETNPLETDTDDEGLSDYEEVKNLETNPNKADTDDDGLSDYEEVIEFETDPTKADTDSDGLSDSAELKTHQTDPVEEDTDNDGLNDGVEVTQYDSNPLQKDSDGDNVNDGSEVNTHETDPTDPDTDSDGLADGEEINEYDSDPTAADTDSDGLADQREVELDTNISNPDTDGDGIEDGPEVHEEIFSDGSPTQMDVYLELDWMDAERPEDSTIEDVVEAYDSAPTTNSDGSSGIDLHVIFDDEIERMDTVGNEELSSIAADHFDHNQTGYHYAVAIEQTTEDDVGGFENHSVPGNAFAFKTDAKEGYYYPDGTISMMFMHELGHSVGLNSWDFEGIDSTSYDQDEYSSAMNYNAESGFLDYNSGEPFDDWKHIEENMDTPGDIPTYFFNNSS